MLVCDLINELEKWDPNDDVVIKTNDGDEYDIRGVGEYYDWSRKEGGESPAILI